MCADYGRDTSNHVLSAATSQIQTRLPQLQDPESKGRFAAISRTMLQILNYFVQCDEVHPTCGNCHRHSVICDFAELDDALKARRSERVRIDPIQSLDVRRRIQSNGPSSVLENQSVSSPISDSFTNIPTPIPTPADRLLELRLFHHYLDMTSHSYVSSLVYGKSTLASNPWTSWILDVAFTSQSLMNALLAYAALHLRLSNPSDWAVAKASHKYMAQAISEHALVLREGVNEKNAESLFATSTFVALHRCASQRFLEDNADKLTLALTWFQAYQGIQLVHDASSPWIQKSPIQPFIEASPALEYFTQKHAGEPIFGFLLDDLDEKDNDPETVKCYKVTVSYLSWVHENPQARTILRFPALVPRKFLDLLAAHDARALTIVGYFLMETQNLKDVWWMKGAEQQEFSKLMKILPRAWWPRMAWAIESMNWQGI